MTLIKKCLQAELYNEIIWYIIAYCRSMYWWGHVLAVAAIIILTLFPLQKTRSKPRQNDVTKTNIEVNNDVNQHTKAG